MNISPKEPNSILRHLIGESGWTLEEFARAVNALGRGQGIPLRYDRTSVAHWLTGSRPRPPVPDVVAQVLSRRLGRLIRAQDTDLLSVVVDPTDATPLTQASLIEDPVLRLLALCRLELAPSGCAVIAAHAFRLQEAAVPPPREGAPSGGSRVSSQPSARPAGGNVLPMVGRARVAHAALLERMLSSYADLDEEFGGGRARTSLATCLADVAVPLLASTAPPALHDRIRSLSAQLALVLASMHADSRAEGAAQIYQNAALHLSAHSADPATPALALQAMSSQASRLGHDWYALGLAARAVGATDEYAASAVRGLAFQRRAVAHALVGQYDAASEDISSAREILRQDPYSAHPLIPASAAAFHESAARVHEVAGDTRRAVKAWLASIDHRAQPLQRSGVLAHASLAGLMIRTGHVQAAYPHVRAFAARHHDFESARVHEARVRLVEQLRPFRSHAAARFMLQHLEPAEMFGGNGTSAPTTAASNAVGG
ncbi:tetratricopeptide repeat protein [Streptomyces sp. IBSNAI002]|uniref:tetratricopeptide repeat protein n=1 Tax=Streptomyces sp. IBSNAI002 TaxID=3457500 RepID=UPI003FD1B4DD